MKLHPFRMSCCYVIQISSVYGYIQRANVPNDRGHARLIIYSVQLDRAESGAGWGGMPCEAS
jgi:hypothetical protein